MAYGERSYIWRPGVLNDFLKRFKAGKGMYLENDESEWGYHVSCKPDTIQNVLDNGMPFKVSLIDSVIFI